MDSTDKRVEAKIAAFKNDQEPAHLQEALNIVETARQDAQPDDEVARKQEVALWLLLFAALELNMDPQWNLEQVPVTGVIPPPSHGVAYPSGIDPSAIADPEVRAQYEQALKASKDYAEWYRIQLLVRRVDERAMAAVERRYGNQVEEDQHEVDLAEVERRKRQDLHHRVGAGSGHQPAEEAP